MLAFHSIIIGIVQGITEFLPISSSAHLVILPYIFNWQYLGLQFDVALHMGTTLAVIMFFWKDWLKILSLAAKGLNRKSKNSEKNNEAHIYPSNLLWQIVLATIPAAITGFFLQDLVEKYLHSPLLLAINLIIFGFILWLVDRQAKTNHSIANISYKQSFWVGLAQSIALIPGVSRSGITMIASRNIGLSRENAARFSFLLGTPATIGAFLLEFRKLDLASLGISFWLGAAAATIAGIFAIRFLLKYLEKSNFSVFFWYRIALALFVLILFFIR